MLCLDIEIKKHFKRKHFFEEFKLAKISRNSNTLKIGGI